MELLVVPIEKEEHQNVILGQTHFIKSAEDLYEAIVNTNPNIQFGVAFNEASGPCLVRFCGNNDKLVELARKNAYNVGAGHFFVIILENGYPINILNAIKQVPEVACIYAVGANPMQVILAETELGRAVLGVVDGLKPKGLESDEHKQERHHFLRMIGYKF